MCAMKAKEAGHVQQTSPISRIIRLIEKQSSKLGSEKRELNLCPNERHVNPPKKRGSNNTKLSVTSLS